MEIVWRGRDKVCYDKVEIFIENGKIPIQSGFSRRSFGPSTLDLTFWTDEWMNPFQAYWFNNMVEMEFFDISDDRRH